MTSWIHRIRRRLGRSRDPDAAVVAWAFDEIRGALAAHEHSIAELATREEFVRWQDLRRADLSEAIGQAPRFDALDIRRLAHVPTAAGVAEPVEITGVRGLPISARIHRPAHGGHGGAVLFLPGHARLGPSEPSYLDAVARWVRAGFVVLWPDALGQGPRRQLPGDRAPTEEHLRLGAAMKLAGVSLAALMVEESRRALDVLALQHDVDAQRIALVGHSGGAAIATYLAAMDPRPAALALTCFASGMTAFLREAGPQDTEQCLQGQARRGLDHLGLLLLRKPRPLFLGAAREDFFPVAATRDLAARLREVGQRFGESDRIAFVEAEGPHRLTSELAQPLAEFLSDALGTERATASAPSRDFSSRVTPQAQAPASRTQEFRRTLERIAAEVRSTHAPLPTLGGNEEVLRRLLHLPSMSVGARWVHRSRTNWTFELGHGLRFRVRTRGPAHPGRIVIALIETPQHWTPEASALVLAPTLPGGSRRILDGGAHWPLAHWLMLADRNLVGVRTEIVVGLAQVARTLGQKIHLVATGAFADVGRLAAALYPFESCEILFPRFDSYVELLDPARWADPWLHVVPEILTSLDLSDLHP